MREGCKCICVWWETTALRKLEKVCHAQGCHAQGLLARPKRSI